MLSSILSYEAWEAVSFQFRFLAGIIQSIFPDCIVPENWPLKCSCIMSFSVSVAHYAHNFLV